MTIQNIVLVDDDEEDGEFFITAIGQIDSSINVQVAESEQELHDNLNHFTPHMLFIDSFLQDQRGSDIVERLKQLPQFSNLPVVMYTGAIDKYSTGRAFAAGAHCYIVKPPTLAEVRQVLGMVISSARAGELPQLKNCCYTDGKFSLNPS